MILVKISVASMPYIISICAPHIILSAMSTVQCISMSLSWQPTASNQSEIYVGNLKSTSAWLAHQSKAKVLCLAKSMQKEQRRWEKLMSRATARGLKWLTATWDGEKPATSEPNRYQALPSSPPPQSPPDWYAGGRDLTPLAIGMGNIMAEIAIKAAQLAQHNRHQTQSSSRQPPDNNGLDEARSGEQENRNTRNT